MVYDVEALIREHGPLTAAQMAGLFGAKSRSSVDKAIHRRAKCGELVVVGIAPIPSTGGITSKIWGLPE